MRLPSPVMFVKQAGVESGGGRATVYNLGPGRKRREHSALRASVRGALARTAGGRCLRLKGPDKYKGK
jgi:hypothetical protein